MEFLVVLVLGGLCLFAVSLFNRATSDKKPPQAQIARIRGNERFDVEVVGESFYRDNFLKICGQKAGTDDELFGDAELRLDDQNPKDRQAVAVFVNGRQVGHLSRDMARTFRKSLADDGIAGRSSYACGCRVYCGGSEGIFSVTLDIPTR